MITIRPRDRSTFRDVIAHGHHVALIGPIDGHDRIYPTDEKGRIVSRGDLRPRNLSGDPKMTETEVAAWLWGGCER